MITDIHMILARPEDGAITQTRAVCLGQSDLPAATDGMAPYEGLWLTVRAYTDATNVAVTLQHCDTKDGTFEDLVSYPAVTVGAGGKIIVAPVPFAAKNWLRLKFSSAVTVNALFTMGVDKSE